MTKPQTTQNEADQHRHNVVRLAYGLLWHVHTDNQLVHEARRTLLAWLNDKDQQKIGIEEAKVFIKLIPEKAREPYDFY